jgi:hypothetical protein
VPTTLAELVLLLAAIYLVYRLLEPLQRRLERLLLRLIDPSKADIIDAELVTRDRKKHKE